LAFLQVLSLRVVFLQVLKALEQTDRQPMAAAPVKVLPALTWLVEVEGVPADWTAPDEAATTGLEFEGVLD